MVRYLSVISILVLIISCQNKNIDKKRIVAIGQALLKTDTLQKPSTGTTDVVFIGGGLAGKISQLREHATNYNFEVVEGDFKEPFGDNRADCILKIDSDYQDVGIRLKYNKAMDKYDILGWMTL
jgi:hypothetical protein